MKLEKTNPIRGYLLVKPDDKAETTNSGIIITTVKSERPQEAVVLKIGGDLLTEYGAVIPSPVKIGDRIIFKKWGGNEVKIDDKEYFFIRFDDVIGIC